MLLSFLLIYGKITDKKYAEFEKEITSPVFYKTNGNFNLGNGKVKKRKYIFLSGRVFVVINNIKNGLPKQSVFFDKYVQLFC